MVLVIHLQWELEKRVIPIVFPVPWFRRGSLGEEACPPGRYTRRHEECQESIICKYKFFFQNNLNVHQEEKNIMVYSCNGMIYHHYKKKKMTKNHMY